MTNNLPTPQHWSNDFLSNGNTLSSTAGTDLLITPLNVQQIVLDGTIVVDAGVVTGATSITSTAFVGDITGDVTGNASGTAATVTTAAQTNITTMRRMEEQVLVQAQALSDLTEKSNRLEIEKKQYLSVFKRHNLTRTARAKPGMVEKRINSGTASVFRQVEADSRELDEADDTSTELSYDTSK